MPRLIKNRIGIHYDRLVVIKLARKDWDGSGWATYWLCKCNCGKEIIIAGCNLQSGGTKSCGCLNRELTSKRSKKFIGENHPRYINGKYCRIIKEERRRKDNWTCQECDIIQKEYYRKLDVHHIDENDTNNNLENMITLCHSCHTKIHEELKRIAN